MKNNNKVPDFKIPETHKFQKSHVIKPKIFKFDWLIDRLKRCHQLTIKHCDK